MQSFENINRPLENNPANKKENSDFAETMRKITKTPLGKVLIGLGASMTLFGASEASAQEGYGADPQEIKKSIEQLKQNRAKKIIEARNSIQDCSLIEKADGTFICKFVADGVKIEATWPKNIKNEREDQSKPNTISKPIPVPGPKTVPGPTSIPGPKPVSMSEWDKN